MNPIILTVAVVLLIYFLKKTLIYRPKNLPPGPSLWFPFLGHYLSILALHYTHTHHGLTQMVKIYKSKVLGFYLGPYPTVVASDERSIKELLTRREFQGRIDQVLSLVRVDFKEEKGILFTSGDLWQEQKRFFLRHLRQFGYGKRSPSLEQNLVDEMKDLIEFLRHEKSHPKYHDGLAMVPSIFAWGNIDLLLQALTGENYRGKDGRDYLVQLTSDTLNFQLYTEPLSGAITLLPFTKYLPPYSAYWKQFTQINANLARRATVSDIFSSNIDSVRDAINNRLETFSEERYSCAIDAFLKEMKLDQAEGKTDTYYTEEQLKLVIQDFTFTASNTISAQLGFLWQQFLIHPEVQTRIQEEIDRVVPRSELPSLNHRKDLHYTEAAIREILRYKTLVPLSVPHRSTADAEFMGYHLQKGTVMITNLTSMHMDSDVWGDPENFRPERFLDEVGHLKKKDNTLPFGLGKRLCPGETFARQNMFMYVACLLQNFTFSLPEGAKLPDDSDYLAGLNIHPKPFWVKVTTRC